MWQQPSRTPRLRKIANAMVDDIIADTMNGTYAVVPGFDEMNLVGSPPEEFANAISQFLDSELSGAMQRYIHLDKGVSNRFRYVFRVDNKYCDYKGYGRGIIELYGLGMCLRCGTYRSFVEYIDPKLFDRIERFLNLIPQTLMANA